MMREPGHEDHPRQTAIELIKLGDLQQRDKDSKAALAFYREALTLQAKLSRLYVISGMYLSPWAKSARRKSTWATRRGHLRLTSNAWP
jgi:hypothetical protein